MRPSSTAAHFTVGAGQAENFAAARPIRQRAEDLHLLATDHIVAPIRRLIGHPGDDPNPGRAGHFEKRARECLGARRDRTGKAPRPNPGGCRPYPT